MRTSGRTEHPRLRDDTWVPLLKMLLTPYKDTRDTHVPGKRGSLLEPSVPVLTPNELSIVKSGASWEDIMYQRAIDAQDERGFSPYFNPNLDYRKKK